MENFVLVGKAKAVFQLIELMAKGEKAETLNETKEKKNRNHHKRYRVVADELSHNFSTRISLN